MAGLITTDQYDNATLDNWLMSISGNPGIRSIGAKFQWDSVNSEVDVTNVMGGMSAYCNKTATGLYTITFETPFRTIAAPKLACGEDYQVHLYESTLKGCKVSLRKSVDMSLTDEAPFWVSVWGR